MSPNGKVISISTKKLEAWETSLFLENFPVLSLGMDRARKNAKKKGYKAVKFPLPPKL